MSVPKLRFNEFDGDWLLDTLENQINFLAGFAFDSKSMSNDVQAYQLIKMSNVYQNQLDLTRNPSYWSVLESKNEKFLLSKGDIVLTLTGTVGKTDYGYNVEITENNKFLLNQRLVRLRGKEQVSLSKFIQYRISTDRFFYHFFNSSKGGTGNQSNVSIEDLKLLELPFPKLKEQTKIASFLSAVDEKINQLTQKHKLLSQYKQGMMQKLFSQQIRFKADDGREFGEWGNSYIGDVCKITTGNKDTQNKVDDGEYPFFVRSQTVERINSYSMDCEAVLTSGDGVGVGKNYHYIDGKFDFHQRVYCLFDFSESILGKYLYIYFSSYFYDRVKRLSAKNSVDSVRMDMVSKMEIQLPCLEEQTKIANFLSSIDQKIEVVGQQIEQAKLWKKGLLQQMFV